MGNENNIAAVGISSTMQNNLYGFQTLGVWDYWWDPINSQIFGYVASSDGGNFVNWVARAKPTVIYFW